MDGREEGRRGKERDGEMLSDFPKTSGLKMLALSATC